MYVSAGQSLLDCRLKMITKIFLQILTLFMFKLKSNYLHIGAQKHKFNNYVLAQTDPNIVLVEQI